MTEEIPNFTPTSDEEARDFVRTLTNYDNTVDELPEAALDSHLRVSKMALYNEVGVQDFYKDAGLAQALVAATAIYAKAAVENYSVSGWSVGDINIQTSAFDNPEGAQFQFWGELHANGLRASDKTPTHAPRNTAEYIGGRDLHRGDN
jgi:hypothetical protein